MNIKELRVLIAVLPDDAPVYIWDEDDDGDSVCHWCELSFIPDANQEPSLHLCML